MLSLFRRGRSATSQIGVYVTPAGVAAAQVMPAAGTAKPRLTACHFEARGADGSAVARVLARVAPRHARAVTVLDPGGYHLLLVEAPDVPPDELRAAVRWRIKDLIDYHIDDAVIDVFEMPPHSRGGRNRTMYAVAAKAELVKQQIELVENAGIELDVIDIPELALRNVATLLAGERGAAFLYLADRRGTLLLVRQGVLFLARHVETGSVTLEEAGELERELVAGLALEVRRSLDYFESHYEQTSIPTLFTSGLNDVHRSQLVDELNIAVENVELDAILDVAAELSPELARLCLPAVGAALRHDPVAL